LALLKAADELYSVGKVAAPYVREGYNDIRSRYGDQDLSMFSKFFRKAGREVKRDVPKVL